MGQDWTIISGSNSITVIRRISNHVYPSLAAMLEYFFNKTMTAGPFKTTETLAGNSSPLMYSHMVSFDRNSVYDRHTNQPGSIAIAYGHSVPRQFIKDISNFYHAELHHE